MVYEEEEEISPDLWQEACWIVIRLDSFGEAGKCEKNYAQDFHSYIQNLEHKYVATK